MHTSAAEAWTPLSFPFLRFHVAWNGMGVHPSGVAEMDGKRHAYVHTYHPPIHT